jgi:hypothetical protein
MTASILSFAPAGRICPLLAVVLCAIGMLGLREKFSGGDGEEEATWYLFDTSEARGRKEDRDAKVPSIAVKKTRFVTLDIA